DAGATCIVTGCAYCKQMLNDSVKTLDMDDRMEVADLATLMLRALPRAAAQDEADSPKNAPMSAGAR
ncbi:MAG: hypothetical protein FJ098_17280, partial [Deltaproteobacteria bacterium]|nr:hypothetical protein [Deltaproteobacteria bacterium]